MSIEALFTVLHGLLGVAASVALVVFVARARRRVGKPGGSGWLLLACLLLPLPYLIPLEGHWVYAARRLTMDAQAVFGKGPQPFGWWDSGPLEQWLREYPILVAVEGLFAGVVLLALRRLQTAWRDACRASTQDS